MPRKYRKRGPRPPRMQVLTCRFPAWAFDVLSAQADHEGVKPSVWVRRVILEALKKRGAPRPPSGQSTRDIPWT